MKHTFFWKSWDHHQNVIFLICGLKAKFYITNSSNFWKDWVYKSFKIEKTFENYINYVNSQICNSFHSAYVGKYFPIIKVSSFYSTYFKVKLYYIAIYLNLWSWIRIFETILLHFEI